MNPVTRSWRSLRREPALSAAVILTTALGVGVASTVFGYLGWFLFPKLDAPHADRAATVHFGTPEDRAARAATFEFEALRASQVFELLAAQSPVGASVGAGTGASPVSQGSRHAWGQLVSGEYFEYFGGVPAVGRLIARQDEQPGAPAVVVLGHRLWRAQFAADPGIVGATISVNGHPHQVIGVAPRNFQGVGYASDFFVSFTGADRISGVARFDAPAERWLVVWGRVRGGTGTWQRSGAALAGLAHSLDAQNPLPDGVARQPLLLPATRFDPELRSDPYFQTAQALTAASVLFLLLGSGNVAGLLLSRAAARDREWALRKALGASPARLASAVLGEAAPLAALGLVGALIVERLLSAWFERTLLGPLAGLGSTWAAEGAHPMRLHAVTIAFSLGATAVALVGAVAGPLARVVRRDPNAALRAQSAGAGTERRALAPRRLLVVAEVALAVVLLIGGGLLVRTLRALAQGAPGFDSRGLVMATVHLPRTIGGASADRSAYLRILDAAAQLPGITGATLAHVGPHSGQVRGAKAAATETPEAMHEVRFNLVGPNYWHTLGVPILTGRALDERDGPDSAAAVVITQSLAERLWPGQPAVGHRLRIAGAPRPGESGPDFEVVGVSRDAGFTSPNETAQATVFFAYGQRLHSRMALLLRTAAPLPGLEPAVRAAVANAGANAALIELVAADEQLRRTLHVQRLSATLAAGLGFGGLFTAVAGLLALQMFQVNLRRRELAVRLSLGATGRHLSRLVLAEGARLAAAGVASGIVLSFLVTRGLRSLLFGVQALDPLTFVTAPLILFAAILLSSWLPARRAARVDPITDLRSP